MAEKSQNYRKFQKLLTGAFSAISEIIENLPNKRRTQTLRTVTWAITEDLVKITAEGLMTPEEMVKCLLASSIYIYKTQLTKFADLEDLKNSIPKDFFND